MSYRLLATVIVAIMLLSVFWGLAEYFGPGFLAIAGFNNSSDHGTPDKSVNLLVDFGNGTRFWFNNTKVPSSDNIYDVTYTDVRGNLVAVWNGYPLNAHLVYKIMGYGCSTTSTGCNGYWSLWLWNGSRDCWSYSAVGADLLKISDVTMAAWYFTTDGSTSYSGNCG